MLTVMAQDGVLIPWLLSVAGLVVGTSGVRYLLRAERHRDHVRRWGRNVSAFTGQSALQTARTLIPVTLLGATLMGVMALSLPLTASPLPEFGYLEDVVVGALALVWTLPVAVSGVLVLVVARTGRPKGLVLPPCRGLDAEGVEAWFVTGEARGVGRPR